ncbi:MAG: hypothetical protein FWD58_03175 [Firmicutes bacterium]|nr:hypothetical protein [Bacillota bacterium]
MPTSALPGDGFTATRARSAKCPEGCPHRAIDVPASCPTPPPGTAIFSHDDRWVAGDGDPYGGQWSVISGQWLVERRWICIPSTQPPNPESRTPNPEPPTPNPEPRIPEKGKSYGRRTKNRNRRNQNRIKRHQAHGGAYFGQLHRRA